MHTSCKNRSKKDCKLFGSYKSLCIFDLSITQKLTTMTLANTKENNAKVAALKTIKETDWVGNITHDSLAKCLAGINLGSSNSGWYNPHSVKINGVHGYFMVNQDGSIYWEARVIKQDDKKFLIEFLSNGGYAQFESKYNEYIS